MIRQLQTAVIHNHKSQTCGSWDGLPLRRSQRLRRTGDVVEEDKIIIGKIGILLGALRVDEFWSYEKPKRGNKMKQYSIHPPC